MANSIIFLLGSFFMNVAVGTFAILSGIEARFRRIAEKGRIDKESLEEKYESMLKEFDSLLEEDELSPVEKLIKYRKKIIDEMKIDVYRDVFKDKNIKKAEKFSPVTGIKPWVISIVFIIGGVLQAIGIIFD